MTNKIAYLTSVSGSEALYITRFFSEGNRIVSDCIMTDNADFPSASFRQYGVETICMPTEVWQHDASGIVKILRARDISLVVVDDFTLPIPVDIIEAFPEAVLVGSAENGMQSVSALSPKGETLILQAPDDMSENLWPRAIVASLQRLADLSQPDMPPAIPVVAPAPEKEWADTLHLRYEPSDSHPDKPCVSPVSGTENSPVPPPVYPQDSRNEGMPPGLQEKSFREPMPPAYMLWSVLALLFCCFLPAIVAIVFSSRVSSLYYSGNIEGARKASRNAEIWIIVSIVLGLVSATFSLPMMLLQ